MIKKKCRYVPTDFNLPMALLTCIPSLFFLHISGIHSHFPSVSVSAYVAFCFVVLVHFCLECFFLLIQRKIDAISTSTHTIWIRRGEDGARELHTHIISAKDQLMTFQCEITQNSAKCQRDKFHMIRVRVVEI